MSFSVDVALLDELFTAYNYSKKYMVNMPSFGTFVQEYCNRQEPIVNAGRAVSAHVPVSIVATNQANNSETNQNVASSANSTSLNIASRTTVENVTAKKRTLIVSSDNDDVSTKKAKLFQKKEADCGIKFVTDRKEMIALKTERAKQYELFTSSADTSNEFQRVAKYLDEGSAKDFDINTQTVETFFIGKIVQNTQKTAKDFCSAVEKFMKNDEDTGKLKITNALYRIEVLRALRSNNNWLENAWKNGLITHLPKARWLWRTSFDDFKTHCDVWEEENKDLL